MIELNMKLPTDFFLACSGGIDSMVSLHFLKRSKKNVTPVYIDHGDLVAESEREFLISNCPDLIVIKAEAEIPKGSSREHVWSKRRHELLMKLPKPVILAHTLDDCVETWVVSTLQGKPALIPKQKKNLIRPFLLTPKDEFYSYAERNGVEWVEDPTNADITYAQRNYVRHELLPRAYNVNPGLRKTVRKMLLKRDKA